MNGIVNFLKPSGMTSSDGVTIVKKALKNKKVGHLGTLDPMAVGVLPIAVGKCTRLFDLFLSKIKVYRAFFDFSFSTNTLDTDGEVTLRSDKKVTIEDIEKVLPEFIGESLQTPPNFSAKNVNGVRAYDLARKGIDVKIKSSQIEIYDIKCIKKYSDNAFVFDITCSAGTYIRAIARDLGEKLGCQSTMTALIRLNSGIFSINESVTKEELLENPTECLISPEKAVEFLPKIVENDEKRVFQIQNGVKLPTIKEDGFYSLYINGKFYGITKIINNKMENYIDLR